MKETESRINLLEILITSTRVREICTILHDDTLFVMRCWIFSWNIGRTQFLSLWLPEIVLEIVCDPGRRV